MAENFGQRIAAYQPSKGVWFWTTAGAVVLTMILGFTWGGWVTGGDAVKRADTAADSAVAELAAEICAFRYLQASDAAVKLTALREETSFRRGTTIEEGGWVTFAGADDPVRGAARLCADRLMEAELNPEVTPVAEGTVEATTPS